MSRIEEIEARRAARREAEEKAKAAQYESDLEELEKAEAAYGCSSVAFLKVDFVPGLPTMVVIRRPDAEYVKRFNQKAMAASGKPHLGGAAIEELADSCVVYPKPDVYQKMCETFGSLKLSVGARAVKMNEAHAVEAGKG